MSTRANVLVIEKNGEWERTTQFYRHYDGYVMETGKDLAVLAYMAKNYSVPDIFTDKNGNEVKRDNFKRIRNRFLGYLTDSENYEAEDMDVGLHGDIEYLYLVKIERMENGDADVNFKLEYIKTPIDSDRNEYLTKLLAGEGDGIQLTIR